jgi:hypothetical protein
MVEGDYMEVVGERGRFSKVYQVSPDLNMMRISTSPIHFQDMDGLWQEIDTRITPLEHERFGFEATRNDYQVYFNPDSTGEALVRFEVEDSSIEFGLETDQPWGTLRPVQGIAEGNQVVYKDIFTGVDLRYQLSSLQMLEEFIVKQPSVAKRISEIKKLFRTDGATWTLETDGSISFLRTKDGESLWRIPRPVMYEVGNPLEQNYGIHYEIEVREEVIALKKILDPAGRSWLMDPRRVFPVVIDDTIDLDENDLTAAGDGLVRSHPPTARYQRLTNRKVSGVGFLNDLVYRSFFEWDTSSIPDGTKIQALGLYLYVTDAYGPGDTVDMVQMDKTINSYPNTNGGNRRLFESIGGETTVYLDDLSWFQSTNVKYIPLGVAVQNSPAITDLESKLTDDIPFGLGVRGSDETDHVTIFGAADAPSAFTEARPDLVIFYGGIEGSPTEPSRPLRNSFWDGTHFWVFFRIYNKVHSFYSTDGTEWTWAGLLAAVNNRHFSVWYEAGGDTVWAAYHEQGPLYSGDMMVKTGTIAGTSISWSTPSGVFGADLDEEEGYDFPSIVRDSNGFCWVVARYYAGTTGSAIRSARSSDPDCTSWETPFDLTPWIDGGGNVRRTGGSVVPLTAGQVYAVYKYNTWGAFPLRGRLFDGSSWQPEEIIDPTSADGVYIQGFSGLSISDVVHLVYIDEGGNLMYVSRDGSWGTPLKLASGNFYSPSLSWDTAADKLYVFFRTDSLHAGNGSVLYKRGAAPYTAGNWSKAITITTNSWSPQKYYGPNADYPLFSNYSGEGKIFVTWVEGIWGLEFHVIDGQ